MNKYQGAPSGSTHLLASSAASINATAVRAAPCVLKGIQGYNNDAAGIWLKLFDQVTAPDPSAGDDPRKAIFIPGATAFAIDFSAGVVFHVGLGFVLVTGSADTDETAIGAGDILGLNLDLG